MCALSLYGCILAFLGVAGFRGRLLDAGHRENVQGGLTLLAYALLIWIATFAWFYWLNRRPIRWRFGLRHLFLATTLAAVVLGFAVVVYNSGVGPVGR
jgi:hypothetical protein